MGEQIWRDCEFAKTYGFMEPRSVMFVLQSDTDTEKERHMSNDKSKRNIDLAVDVYQWLKEHEMFDGCIIYFNGIAIYSESTWGGEHGTLMPDGIGYVYHNRRATDYFEYGNDDTVSMSFDGSDLYDVLNLDWEYPYLSEDFRKVFERHGMFFELGYSWSLSAYSI